MFNLCVQKFESNFISIIACIKYVCVYLCVSNSVRLIVSVSNCMCPVVSV